MFTLIGGLPPFVVGVTASGKMVKKDYVTVLEPALKKATDEWKGVNLLLVMATDFKNFTVGAWMQDIKVNTAYFLKWNKMAMVSNKSTLDVVSTVFDLIAPAEVKSFNCNQLTEAREWVAEL